MKKRRTRRSPTASLAKIFVIANQPAGWCGNPYSPCTALPHGEDGFPRRCAPRNDSFYENHPAMRRGGVLPRPPDMLSNSENGRGRAAAPTHTLYFPCRAAPVCAAARHAPHSQRRGTLAPPYRHFIEFVGVSVPTTRTHRTPISLRRAGCPHPAADTRRTRQSPVIARA